MAESLPAVVLHGIPNCDTVKRARSWLEAQGIAHRFHDLRKAGVPGAALETWCASVGWQRLLNRKGTTWRRLDARQQAAVVDADTACALMRAEPTLIKRPVVDWGQGRITVGFDPEAWARRD
jgi:Spx/MgsR family transcriptional regulator